MGLMKCKSCGNEVATDAVTCPKCGSPVKKKMGIVKLFFVVLGGLFLLCFLGSIVGGKSKGGGSSAASSDAPAAPAPEVAQQLPWIATVNDNCAKYKAAPNEIKKSAIYNENEALIAKTKVTNISGKLVALRTDQGGDELSLKIKVGDVDFHTESLFGAIKKGSAVYNAAAEMTVGQCVVFSASSLKASSMVERSKVCDTEYFAVFTSIAPCK
ncbi:MAG: zinc ribbon domain-containing protein [Myxococcaceae bacterium]|nr:zinc ribbon domain-containing protein [Myxococcaceae bacterium]